MYANVVRAREEYGDCYATSFPDGLIIPWKPLSLLDYTLYRRDYARNLIPHAVLEDEIFKKSVLEPSIIQQMDFLPAGIVTTTVNNIWEYSGPIGVDAFNNDLNLARMLVTEEDAVMNQLMILITTAFPYKPEDVYAMDYKTICMRVAQAESKLMQAGLLNEPIVLTPPEEVQEDQISRPKVDAKALWDQQQQAKQPAKKLPKKKWWKESPVLEAQAKHKINFAAESSTDDNFVLDSHDRLESKEMQEHLIKVKTQDASNKMIEDAEWIFSDLFNNLDKLQK